MFDMVKRYNKFLAVFLAVSVLLGSSSFHMASAEENSLQPQSYSENSQSQPSVENNSGSENVITKKKLPVRRIRPRQKNWVLRHPIWTVAGAGVLVFTGYELFKDDKPDPGTIEFVERVIKKHDERNYAYSLLYATKYGQDDLVIKLLEVIGDNIGDNLDVINVWEPYGCGMTPLLYACRYCTPATVGALLKHHADVNVHGWERPDLVNVWKMAEYRIDYRDPAKCNASSFQARNEIFALLVDRGFQFNGSQVGTAGNRLVEILTRPLISEIDAKYARTLIRAGANVTKTDTQGRTPLVLAAGKGELGIVLQLINCAKNNKITQPEKEAALGAAGENQAIRNLLNTL